MYFEGAGVYFGACVYTGACVHLIGPFFFFWFLQSIDHLEETLVRSLPCLHLMGIRATQHLLVCMYFVNHSYYSQQVKKGLLIIFIAETLIGKI